MPEQPTPTPVAVTPPKAEEPKPDPLAASVAAAVSKLRRDAGLSERAAAKKLGTSQTQLRRMEDPRYLPSLRSLARVAQAYGAHLAVAFEAQEDKAKERPTGKQALAAKPSPAVKPARTAGTARASGSPSKGRRAAPGRARGGARGKRRRAGPRRKGR